jgi:hypothetical protein
MSELGMAIEPILKRRVACEGNGGSMPSSTATRALISRTKAELIIEERIENGIFKKVDDIFDRVEELSSEQRNSINTSYVKRYFNL